MSDESISLQKSLVLSLPSRRRRRRMPIMPITVAMQTELELRGSRASSFIPALNSLEGGTLDCGGRGEGGNGIQQKYEISSHRSTTIKKMNTGSLQYRSSYLFEARRRRRNRRSLSQVVFPAERFYQQFQQKRNTESWEEGTGAATTEPKWPVINLSADSSAYIFTHCRLVATLISGLCSLLNIYLLFVKPGGTQQQLFTCDNTRLTPKPAEAHWLISQKDFIRGADEKANKGGEVGRDQRYQPLDLSRAEPAEMLLRLSFSSFWSGIKRWLKRSSGFGGDWSAGCNYCGTKHGFEAVQGKKEINLTCRKENV